MKCTYDEAVKGYMSLLGLRKNRIPGDVAKIFFSLRKKLKDATDFETEEETKYVEENGGKISDAGKVAFDEPDKLIGFLNKQNEIRSLEFEYDARSRLPLSKVKSRISGRWQMPKESWLMPSTH